MDAKLEHGPKWIRALVIAQRVVCVALVVTMLGLIMMQVVWRYLLDMPLRWTEEVARFVFIWLAFLGAAFVMGEGRHIAVDVVGRVVGRRGRVALECLTAAVALVVVVTIAIAGFGYASQMMAIGSAAVGIPRGLWIAAVPVGLCLLGLHAVVNAAVAIYRGEPIWAHSLGAEAEVDVPTDHPRTDQPPDDADDRGDVSGSGR